MPKEHRRFTTIQGFTYQIGHAIQTGSSSYDEQQIIKGSEPPESELFGTSEEFTESQREQLQQAGCTILWLLKITGKELYTSKSLWFTATNQDQLAATLSTTSHHGEITVPPSPFLPNSQGKNSDEQLAMLVDFIESFHTPGVGGFMGNPIDYIQINEAYKEAIEDEGRDFYGPRLPFTRTSTQYDGQDIIGGRVTLFWEFMINSIPAGTAARGVALAPIIAPASSLLQLD